MQGCGHNISRTHTEKSRYETAEIVNPKSNSSSIEEKKHIVFPLFFFN